jgi:hypothetical protein
VALEDLLERHLTVELGIDGDEDLAQAAARMGPQDAKPLAIGGGGVQVVAGRAVGVLGAGGELGERVFDRRVTQRGQRLWVDRPAGIAARLFSAEPPCFFRCKPTIAATPARWSASRSPRAAR